MAHDQGVPPWLESVANLVHWVITTAASVDPAAVRLPIPLEQNPTMLPPQPPPLCQPLLLPLLEVQLLQLHHHHHHHQLPPSVGESRLLNQKSSRFESSDRPLLLALSLLLLLLLYPPLLRVFRRILEREPIRKKHCPCPVRRLPLSLDHWVFPAHESNPVAHPSSSGGISVSETRKKKKKTRMETLCSTNQVISVRRMMQR